MKATLPNRLALFAVTTATMLAASPANAAEPYPCQALKIVSPYPAGGTTDILARAIGQVLTTAWKQSVVVDNVPGAVGTPASERSGRAAADGYNVSALSTTPLCSHDV